MKPLSIYDRLITIGLYCLVYGWWIVVILGERHGSVNPLN